MLVSMKIDSEEYNSNKELHGCREDVEVSEDGLLFIKTYADTNHEWWKSFSEGNAGGEILVDAKEEVQKGVWVTLGGNFHSDISDCTNLKNNHSLYYISASGVPIMDLKTALNTERVAEYMVCDSVEQAVEYWKGAIENPDHKYVIALMPVRKSDEPDTDGWRWHKWGEYIGTQKPQCEYLFDEPEIDMVYCAHIYNVEEV